MAVPPAENGVLWSRGYEKADVEPIGQGCFGKVYLARHVASGALCVAKVVNLTRMSERDISNHNRELELSRRFRHPNIVSTIDSWEARGQMIIVMEYCDGGTLRSVCDARMDRDEPLPEAMLTRWAFELLLGLTVLHAGRTLHRDIKPENVLLTRGGTLKIADFGISRTLEAELTSAKSLCGTPYYIPPEIGLGRGVPASGVGDVWSAGVMLYELACGAKAFDAADLAGLIDALVHGPIPAVPAELGYSAPFRHLVAAMMTRDSDARPTARALLNHPALAAHFATYVARLRERGDAASTLQQRLFSGGAAAAPTPAAAAPALPACRGAVSRGGAGGVGLAAAAARELAETEAARRRAIDGRWLSKLCRLKLREQETWEALADRLVAEVAAAAGVEEDEALRRQAAAENERVRAALRTAVDDAMGATHELMRITAVPCV